MATTLRSRLSADLPVALRAGDRVRVSALRTTLAAIANAEAVDPAAAVPTGLGADVARRRLTEDDVVRIVAAERDEHRALAQEMRELGQEGEADACAQRAAVLEGYLAGHR